MIRRTNSEWGFWSNLMFGLVILLDAVISIGTLGFYSGGNQLDYARWRTKRMFQKRKKAMQCSTPV
jgi:hypothetical protein